LIIEALKSLVFRCSFSLSFRGCLRSGKFDSAVCDLAGVMKRKPYDSDLTDKQWAILAGRTHLNFSISQRIE